jgi:PII-like signaling protein
MAVDCSNPGTSLVTFFFGYGCILSHKRHNKVIVNNFSALPVVLECFLDSTRAVPRVRTEIRES